MGFTDLCRLMEPFLLQHCDAEMRIPQVAHATLDMVTDTIGCNLQEPLRGTAS